MRSSIPVNQPPRRGAQEKEGLAPVISKRSKHRSRDSSARLRIHRARIVTLTAPPPLAPARLPRRLAADHAAVARAHPQLAAPPPPAAARCPRSPCANTPAQENALLRGGRLRGAAASHRAEAARGGGGGLAHRVLRSSIHVSTTLIHSSLPSISISFQGFGV
jgi:hypothetical protein